MGPLHLPGEGFEPSSLMYEISILTKLNYPGILINKITPPGDWSIRGNYKLATPPINRYK